MKCRRVTNIPSAAVGNGMWQMNIQSDNDPVLFRYLALCIYRERSIFLCRNNAKAHMRMTIVGWRVLIGSGLVLLCAFNDGNEFRHLIRGIIRRTVVTQRGGDD